MENKHTIEHDLNLIMEIVKGNQSFNIIKFKNQEVAIFARDLVEFLNEVSQIRSDLRSHTENIAEVSEKFDQLSLLNNF